MPENGPDRYRGNGDQDWAALRRRGATFAILKVTQGTSYDTSWYEKNLPRARAAGLVVGHYHMLDGSVAGNGQAQAAYFLSKAHMEPGDVIPFMDFERSGEGSGSDAEYKQRGLEFIAAVHAAGFQCGIYGHERVKALFGTWDRSGADAFWLPGDTMHTDTGPVNLFQFGPFTHFAGVDSDGGDWSVAITALPLIGGDDVDPRVDDLVAGFKAQRAGQKFDKTKGPLWQVGYAAAKTGGDDNDSTVAQHKHVPGGVLSPPKPAGG